MGQIYDQIQNQLEHDWHRSRAICNKDQKDLGEHGSTLPDEAKENSLRRFEPALNIEGFGSGYTRTRC